MDRTHFESILERSINHDPHHFYSTGFKGEGMSRFEKGHKKIGGFVKGSKHKSSSIELVRQSLIGKRGPLARNWRGGVTPINMLIRSSSEMKAWRVAVFERDNYTCQLCFKRGGIKLHADHIKPFARFPELRFELSNGRTLCKPCHQTTPTYKGRTKPCVV